MQNSPVFWFFSRRRRQAASETWFIFSRHHNNSIITLTHEGEFSMKKLFVCFALLAVVVSASSCTKAPPATERMVLTINGVEYAFRQCPDGTFMMGSPAKEQGRYGNETQHQVTLTQDFWMLETPVTQEMWESVMGGNPSYFKGSGQLPVEQVSWDDCQEYVQRLNALKVAPSGYKFSLPTEAQWEYACRAGTTTALNDGKNLKDDQYDCPNLDKLGWYNWKNKESQTHEVGLKKANAWGLFDMHGNVREWCLDKSTSYPEDSVTDPLGHSNDVLLLHVFRGGSWKGIARYCRSACRGFGTPSSRNENVGARIALVHQ